MHPQIARLQAKLVTAEEAAKQADSIAQAAMEAAEEAVRDEMETIAGGCPLLGGTPHGITCQCRQGCLSVGIGMNRRVILRQNCVCSLQGD